MVLRFEPAHQSGEIDLLDIVDDQQSAGIECSTPVGIELGNQRAAAP